MNQKGSIKLDCVVCFKKFNRPPSKCIYTFPVCDKVCRGQLMRKPKAATGETVRIWLKRRNLITECAKCSYSERMEILVVHHKDQDRKNNDMSNIEVLCPNCHALEHYGV